MLGFQPAGNVDGDNDVDFVDYSTLAAYWMETDCDRCAADLNCDTNIDALDLLDFAENWLTGL